MELQELYTVAYEMMQSLNLTKNIDKYNVISFKSSSKFGEIDLKTKLIKINEVIIAYERKETINTIIHELLHAYCFENYSCTNHRGDWARLARFITTNSIYEITTTADSSLLCTDVQKAFGAKYKYKVRCDSCQTVYQYAKKTKLIQALENNQNHNYSCCSCKSKNFILEIL